MERKLASIRKIADIQPIQGADVIEVATVDGWKVVVKRGEYKIGDLAVYLEIDSWVPTELASFLSNGKEPREYNGVKGERLKTIRLRNQVSQGLLLPVDNIEGKPFITGWFHEDGIGTMAMVQEGDDVTECLNIQKWEAPIPAQLAGKAKGNFPTGLIPKTDQERIQNCFGSIQKRDGLFLTERFWNEELQEVQERDVVLPDDFQKPTYEVTLKLDGSSMTIFRWEDVLRVCSRNLELTIDEENSDNSFVKMALEIGDLIPEGFAFQGEIWGESIQGNKENIKGHKFSVFDIFDIQKHEYLNPIDRRKLCDDIGIEHVPVLGTNWNAPVTIEEGLALANGPSINAKKREGIVYKCNNDPSFSFKIISNEWLLNYKE